MGSYKYDYNKTCFFKVKMSINEVKYYLKVDNKYIEVSEQVFKVCRRSYDKIKNDEKNKVDRSILNFQDIDQSAFFVVGKDIEQDIINQIYLKDIANRIKREIMLLPERDKNIAICIFIEEYSDRETSRILHIPQTTVSYRKKVIREKIKNNIKKFCSIED